MKNDQFLLHFPLTKTARLSLEKENRADITYGKVCAALLFVARAIGKLFQIQLRSIKEHKLIAFHFWRCHGRLAAIGSIMQLFHKVTLKTHFKRFVLQQYSTHGVKI